MEMKNSEICDANLIASYVDGELEDGERAFFEQHLDSCSACRAELLEHRLFMCELDAAMSERVDVRVPKDFSRIVAARAESDMSGVRSFAERRKALGFCMILALVAFALLGTAARSSIVSGWRGVAAGFLGAAGFLWTTLYDTAAGVTVISRLLSRKFIVETGSFGLLIVLLALAVLLLSRLISNYHRTGATE